MSEKKENIIPGKYYHIYNRGNNGENIFFDTESYSHFLRLYKKYINPVADTLAWCLLKNHFHILVYIKTEEEINKEKLHYSTVEKPKQVNASRQFSHLFNSYTQSINKKFNRTGTLFESRFERKLVKNHFYLQKLIYYIHNNPVKHGFVKEIDEYPWSSYETILSIKPTELNRTKVIENYKGLENFLNFHKEKQDLSDIKELLIDE